MSKSETCAGCALLTCPGPVLGEFTGEQVDILFVGEALGAVEVMQGRPMVGEAGQVLRRTIREMKYTSYGITNIWKCRPPGNVLPEEGRPGEFCAQGLLEDLKRCTRVVVPLGTTSLRAITEQDFGITQIQGRMFSSHGYTLLPMYHPSYMRRNGYFWRDWELAHTKLAAFLAGRRDYIPAEQREVTKIADSAELVCWLQTLTSDEYRVLSCDIETSAGYSPWAGARVISMSISWSERRSIAFMWSDLSEEARKLLALLFIDPKKSWGWYNGQFDTQFLRAEGFEVRIDWDAQLEVHVVDERGSSDESSKSGVIHSLKRDAGTFLDACFAAGTRVLMADLSWKVIEDVAINDVVMSVGHSSTLARESTRVIDFVGAFMPSRVTNVRSLSASTVNVKSEFGVLRCTPDHRFFIGNNTFKWELANNLEGSRVRFVGLPPTDLNDFDRGWTAGYLEGDGYIRHYVGRSGHDQARLAVSSVDVELADEAFELLKCFGCEHVRRFVRPAEKVSGFSTVHDQHVVQCDTTFEIFQLENILYNGPETLDYMRGWLAGMYDAEGTPRFTDVNIPQKHGTGVQQKIVTYATRLGFGLNVWYDVKQDFDYIYLQNPLRFFVECPGVLSRKRQLLGTFNSVKRSTVLSVSVSEMANVFDITVEAGNFIAEGFLVHNSDWEFDAKQYAPKKTDSYELIPRDKLLQYNGFDTVHTTSLSKVCNRYMAEEETLDYYHHVIVPTFNMLSRARFVGMRVDIRRVQSLQEEMKPVLEELTQQMVEVSGDHFFNPGSPIQVKKALWARGLKVEDTRKETLSQYEGDELVDAMRDYRDCSKMLSTYVVGLVKDVYDDLRVHPDWRVPTETGRPRCSGPNLLGMPRKAEIEEHRWKRYIKEQFIADPGTQFLHLDRKQSEVRCMVFLADCLKFIEHLMEDPRADIHGEFTKMLYGTGYTKEQRVLVKMIVFGLIYNREAPSLAAQFTAIEREKAKKVGQTKYKVWSVREAQRFIDDFFELFPEMLTYKTKVMKEATGTGILRGYMGRLRRFGLVNYDNKHHIENESVNFMPSNLSADLNFLSCVETMKAFGKYGVEVLVPIHDAGLFRIPKDSVYLKDEITGLWEGLVYKELTRPGLPLAEHNPHIPFPVDVSVGERWSDL